MDYIKVIVLALSKHQYHSMCFPERKTWQKSWANGLDVVCQKTSAVTEQNKAELSFMGDFIEMSLTFSNPQQTDRNENFWNSIIASNHPVLISVCLPSPSLVQTRPQSHSQSHCEKLSNEQRNQSPPICSWYVSWQRERVILIIWVFFITVQDRGKWQLLNLGSHNQSDDGWKIKSEKHHADETHTNRRAEMFAQRRTS